MTIEKKPQRSFIGKVIKWAFILFNILMLVWVISGINTTANTSAATSDQLEKTATEMGGTIGVMMILFIWGIGAVILGMLTYFTKAKK